MKLKEDLTLSIRGLLNSPLESLLLVIGLALSIGATAAGLGMLDQARQDGNALLEQAEYREIVIDTNVAGDDMEQAVSLQVVDADISLTADDLDAASISPDITHSYLSSRTRLRLNNGTDNFSPGFEPPEATPDAKLTEDANAEVPAAEPSVDKRSAEGDDTTSTSEAEAPANPFRDIELAEVDGPQPVLDELSGYEVSDQFFDAMNLTVASGSVFTSQDMASAAKVVVLGSELARTLFEDGESLGRQIASFDSIYTIIGVLEPYDQTYDNSAFIPTSLLGDSVGAQAQRGRGRFSASLHFTVDNATQLSAAAEQLTGWFESQYGTDALNISVPREEAERAIERTQNMAIITLVLALAGLLIASVNVSNILYGRALRRRKQIGILKALGASQRNIFTLFFSEGGALLVTGAILGIGVVALFGVALAQNEGDSLSLVAVIAGLLLSSAITLAFTLIPALQATQVQPAQAMRTE